MPRTQRARACPTLSPADVPPTHLSLAKNLFAMGNSFTTSSYFETQQPPKNLPEEQVKVAAFLERMKALKKRVVLVTVRSDSRLLDQRWLASRAARLTIALPCLRSEWRN